MDDHAEIKAILSLFPFSGLLVDSPSYVYFAVVLETVCSLSTLSHLIGISLHLTSPPNEIHQFAREKLVGDLWRYLATVLPDEQDQLRAARRLREGLLKASPLVGFPRVRCSFRIASCDARSDMINKASYFLDNKLIRDAQRRRASMAYQPSAAQSNPPLPPSRKS